MPLPLWVVALALAALAPLSARMLAIMFDQRSHRRGIRLLEIQGEHAASRTTVDEGSPAD